jgi:uncharacterized protein YutE (UPF0331/DUF86 family)
MSEFPESRKHYDQTYTQAKPYKAIVALRNAKLPPMMVAIRSQLIIEEAINVALSQALSGVNNFESRKMSYATKVNLLGGFGVIQKALVKSLLMLNDLRNSYSHDPYFEVNRRRVRKMISTALQAASQNGMWSSEDRKRLLDFANESVSEGLDSFLTICILALGLEISGWRDNDAYMRGFRLWSLKWRITGTMPESEYLLDLLAQNRKERLERGEF